MEEIFVMKLTILLNLLLFKLLQYTTIANLLMKHCTVQVSFNIPALRC